MRHLATLALVTFASLVPSLTQGAPANDKIENAISLDANVTFHRVQGEVTGVTEEDFLVKLPDVTTPGYFLSPSVWYKWTAPMAGKVSVQGVGLNFTTWGVTLLGPVPQDVYTVVAYDNVSTSYNGADTWFTSYEYEVEAGKQYLAGLMTSGVQNPNRYTYVHRFTQGSISDDFATRTKLGGTNFTIRGNNGSFDSEEGEPDHAANQITSSDKSAWMTWRSPDSRKSVTIEVKTTSFEPIVVIYTGDSLTELTRITRSQLATDSKGSTATATFIAEDGVDYHIVVDGSKARAGAFSLSLKASTARPGFIVQPMSATVQQGNIATFSATASITGETVEYQWERLPAGSKTWEPLPDDEIFSGTKTAELSVLTSLDMNKDRYRVSARDVVDRSYSRSAILTVTEFPAVNTEVLGTVNVELAGGEVPPPTAGGSYFATGLPRGLTLDPETGIISGVVDAKAGTYRITYGSTNGKVKNPEQFILQIIVAPFAPRLTGSFEALLDSLSAPSVPSGKLSLKVSTNGRYTGSYFVLTEGKAYPFRGTLDLDEATRTAGVPNDSPLQISRGRVLEPLQLTFTLAEPTAESSSGASLSSSIYDQEDNQIAQGFDGEALPQFSTLAPAAWAGTYTARLSDVRQIIASDDNLSIPLGSGYATASVTAKTGKLALRARLPDNTPFTASLSSSGTASYRLGQRVHAPGGSIAGRILLAEDSTLGAELQRYHVNAASGSNLYWTKPERLRDRLYPEGFGDSPLALTFLMEPWTNPQSNFPAAFGLSSLGDVMINIVAWEMRDGNYALDSRINPYGLPIDVRFGQTGKLTLVSPATNPTNFTFKVNPATGLFSGSYQLVGSPPTNSTLVRKVTFSGVLFQPSSTLEGDIIGGGLAIVPPFSEFERYTTSLIEFRAGPTAEPIEEAEPGL